MNLYNAIKKWLLQPEDCPFKVGQKVECIDDAVRDPAAKDHMKNWPVKGETYTVSKIIGNGIRLKELKNQPISWDAEGEIEWSFNPDRFRQIS